MENLTLQEPLPAPPSNSLESNSQPPSAPHGLPQHVSLPPQMFTTAAQLLDLTDKKLMLVLRDGRKLIGVLRSWDQFANLVLQDTIERIFVQDLYADVGRGIFLVRGENVLLLGEIDLDRDDVIPEPYRKASVEEVHALFVQESQDRKRGDKMKQAKLQELGFEVEHTGEILL